ncbi:hypothetical protein [Deinococcus ficus]|uniref:hypothetical protein n=1 Tax=Deinococcus ficus TaxID=317577 RepID=UPI0012DE1D68|nr:hypothetical protein [Deinococcus ficus]
MKKYLLMCFLLLTVAGASDFSKLTKENVCVYRSATIHDYVPDGVALQIDTAVANALEKLISYGFREVEIGCDDYNVRIIIQSLAVDQLLMSTTISLIVNDIASLKELSGTHKKMHESGTARTITFTWYVSEKKAVEKALPKMTETLVTWFLKEWIATHP